MLAPEGSRFRFAKVQHQDQAADTCLKVTLFRGADGRVRAWYIGPLAWCRTGGVSIPYLPKRQAVLAVIAILRAEKAARDANVDVCIIDPDDLWTSIWPS